MPDKFASINKVLGTETDLVEVDDSPKPIDKITEDPVSYTHLTLPTILLV